MLQPDLAIELPDISLSAGDLILNALADDPDNVVVQFADQDRSITAKEYRDLLSQYSQALASLELADGSRIGLLSRNRPEVLFVSGSFSFIPLVSVPMHPMGSIDDMAYMIEDAGIEALIFDPAYYAETAAELQNRQPGLRHLLSLGPCAVGRDLSAIAAAQVPGPLAGLRQSPEQIGRLTYSGGTTGKPKAIMTSGRCSGVLLNIMLGEWEWPLEVRQLICSPLSHGGGAVVLPTLVKRGTMVVLKGFDPTAVLEAIERHRITCVLLVPTMIYALLDHPRLKSYDLSSLEIIYYGASSISPTRLAEGIEKLGPIFFQFYGQAESPMTVTTLKRSEHDPKDLNRLASCGRPVPWVKVALLDDDNQPVSDGTPGEICVRGPLMMSGYLNKPEQTAEAFAGGWLHTGDVAVRDPDGFFRIVDRKKDMIVSGGFNVYPREVEDVLTSHPDVAGAAVVGLPDEKWGEMVKALVVLRPGATVAAEALIALVKDRKGAVQAPKSIDFVDAIPLSGLGKPDKKAIRAMYA